jgi:hypothetical protein
MPIWKQCMLHGMGVFLMLTELRRPVVNPGKGRRCGRVVGEYLGNRDCYGMGIKSKFESCLTLGLCDDF